jgi:hypothetical protein
MTDTSLVDSIILSVGVSMDTLFTTIRDTILVKHVLRDSDSILINATAFCADSPPRYSSARFFIFTGAAKWDDMAWDKDLWR